MSEKRDHDEDYVEARSTSVSPRELAVTDVVSQDGSSGHRTPQNLVDEPRSDSERPSARVGSLILQAAQQAKQEEQAQATARSAAQIAAQKRKMRGRARRIMHVEDVPEAEPYYDMENALRDENYDGIDRPDKVAEGKDFRGHHYGHEGTKAYNLPLPPAFALLDIGKPGKKTRQSWIKGSLGYRIFIWTLFTLFVVSSVVGVMLLAIFVVLDPKQPKYVLDEVRVQSWVTYKDELGEMPYSTLNGVAVPTVYLYSTSELIVLVENTNKKIAAVYPNTTFQVFYHNIALGVAQAPSVTVDPMASTHITATWKCDACPLQGIGEYLLTDQQSGSVPLRIVMDVCVGVYVDGMMTPDYKYKEEYNVRIRPPGT